ncbi:MAG TPA: hypothetical protein VHA30_00515 [Patescibacteria group bacterium]|nr:hypothetical protein [Patescibacteria group bacterium]
MARRVEKEVESRRIVTIRDSDPAAKLERPQAQKGSGINIGGLLLALMFATIAVAMVLSDGPGLLGPFR